ncbi:MAG TPA: Crp/Fnr family transcriptional regulator [Bacteroidales bacterium]|nr:Crp/Fnr family transcriptional regulator [Bacteroidales bacterium]
MDNPLNASFLATTSLSECFLHLSTEQLELLNTKKTQIYYQKGETLFKQGAFSPYVLYIIEGLIKVSIQTGGTKQLNVFVANTGDFLAFSVIFGKEHYLYSATAMRNSRVCMIDKDALKQVFLLNPQFAFQITTRNNGIEEQLVETIKNLSYKQMRGKLASALSYLSRGDFIYENVFENLSRQELADFAGITLESTVKYLKEFERDGILNLDGKNILISDREKLSYISRTG